MSDFTPLDLSSDQLSSMMVGAVDGQITASDLDDGRIAFAMRCSHVEDGACAECVRPTLYALLAATEERRKSRRRIATLEARLRRVLLYHTQFSSMNGGGHVWSGSRKRTGGRRG